VPRRRDRGQQSGRRERRPAPKSGVELEKFSSSDLRAWQRHAENLEKYHVQLYYHLEGLRALQHAQLCEALCASKPVNLSLDNWVRIVDYRYCLQPLSATGSLVRGGRFNLGIDLDSSKFPIFPALYIAEDYETAYEERFGLPPTSSSGIEGHELALRTRGSFTSVNVSGNILNIFDLRSAVNLKEFAGVISKFEMPKEIKDLARSVGIPGPFLVTKGGLLKKTLLTHNWRLYPSQYEIPANPQVFGRLILDAGFDGIMYPSTKGPKNCVALFPTNFSESDSYVEVADAPPPGATHLRLDSTSWQNIAAPPKP
jgi:RES domain-containing protein